jgi:hypothetical protein
MHTTYIHHISLSITRTRKQFQTSDVESALDTRLGENGNRSNIITRQSKALKSRLEFMTIPVNRTILPFNQ